MEKNNYLKAKIPLNFFKEIEDCFESIKRFGIAQKDLKKKDPQLHDFLSQDEYKTISTDNSLLIKWVFLTNDDAFWADILKYKLDHVIEIEPDAMYDDYLFEYDAQKILLKGLSYFDLSKYEVSLLWKEIVCGDLTFFIYQYKQEMELENYQHKKDYKNFSSLVSAYLELKKTKEAGDLLATINPTLDLTPWEIPDYLMLQVRLLNEMEAENQIETDKILDLLIMFETYEDMGDSFGVTDPYEYGIAWLTLIEKIVSRENLRICSDEPKKRHDQILLKLIPLSNNPGTLLSIHQCFYLPSQYQAERMLLNINFPNKLHYYLYDSAFFQITVPPTCCENGRCDMRDLIWNHLRSEFPESQKWIDFRYFAIMWRHAADERIFIKPAALRTVEILDKRYRQCGKLRLTKELGPYDRKYLGWLLKSWVCLEQDERIRELVLFVFKNAEMAKICPGEMLEILLNEKRYDAVVRLGKECLSLTDSEKYTNQDFISMVNRIMIAMAWAYVSLEENKQIVDLCTNYEKGCYGLSVEDTHYEELKRIRKGEEIYTFCFDEDAYIG